MKGISLEPRAHGEGGEEAWGGWAVAHGTRPLENEGARNEEGDGRFIWPSATEATALSEEKVAMLVVGHSWHFWLITE